MTERYPTSTTGRVVADADDRVTYAAPLDRVRWASILAGLFTVLATLITLTVLGIAIGLQNLETDNLEAFGIGATIYGSVAAIVAFFLGGFLAARTGAVAGAGNGLLNGAMVWIVAIPLLVNFLGSGIGTLLGSTLNAAGSALNTAAQVAAPAVDDAVQQAQDPAVQATAQGLATEAADQVGALATQVGEQLENVDGQDIERAADQAAPAPWAVLAALGLTALAALGGGLLGTRQAPTDVAVVRS